MNPRSARAINAATSVKSGKRLSVRAAMTVAATLGGLCGLLGVMLVQSDMFRPDGMANAATANASLAGTTVPLPFDEIASRARPGATNTSAQSVASTGKADMAAPLLTRFASFSGDGLAADVTPLVLQASLSVEDTSSGSADIMKTPPPEPVDKTFTLKAGETLVDKLVELGVNEALARALSKEVARVWPLKKIRSGQKFMLTLDRQLDFYGKDVTYPVYLSFVPESGKRVVVEADDEGLFTARLLKDGKAGTKSKTRVARAEPDFRRVRGRISSTLYAAARDEGVPDYIISQMMRAFSHQIDLQRQVHKGDTFEVLYGKPFSGTSRRRAVLHFARLTSRGKTYTFYRFTTPKGKKTGYFDPKGRSVRRGIMRTPISGARISSGFGYRRHPVLGYTKLHTGVDFAAPRGTPIRAAGGGMVTHAGWRGGYGKTVMIKHDNGYVTLYAHQSRIARGIRKGVRVRQGQVIGYVGSTGRTTGPHLHFEVRIKGKPANPLRVRTSSRFRLSGKALLAFQRHKARIDKLLKNTPVSSHIARK